MLSKTPPQGPSKSWCRSQGLSPSETQRRAWGQNLSQSLCQSPSLRQTPSLRQSQSLSLCLRQNQSQSETCRSQVQCQWQLLCQTSLSWS